MISLFLALHAAVAQTWLNLLTVALPRQNVLPFAHRLLLSLSACAECLSPCVGVKMSRADMECHDSEKKHLFLSDLYENPPVSPASSVKLESARAADASRRASTYLRWILMCSFVFTNLISCGRFLKKIHLAPVFLAPWFSVCCITGEATCSVFIIRMGEGVCDGEIFPSPFVQCNGRHTHPLIRFVAGVERRGQKHPLYTTPCRPPKRQTTPQVRLQFILSFIFVQYACNGVNQSFWRLTRACCPTSTKILFHL